MILIYIIRHYTLFCIVLAILARFIGILIDHVLIQKKFIKTVVLCVIIMVYIEYCLNLEPMYILKLFANQEDLLETYILLSDEIEFTDSQLKTFSSSELYFLRNGIFALSGREFEEEELMEAFQNYEWYVPEIPPGEFTWSMLNEKQVINIKKIQKIEQR